VTEHQGTPPLSEEQVRQWQVRDTVLLDGIVWGVRDATLIRMFDQGVAPPVDLQGAVLLHVAPNVRKTAVGYEPLSIGTTTSMRMDRFSEGLLTRYGVRAIIGKGGLSERSSTLFQQHGAAYLAIVGGAASVETLQVEAIEAVYWEDLMPECLWRFRVRSFGPLIVAMDAQGGNIYREVADTARARLGDLYRQLGVTG
jgi:L(+)-tartrate dehydratase beta subunit